MTKREVLARRGGRKADAAGVRYFEVPISIGSCEQVQGLPTQEGTLRFPVSVPRHSASRKPHEISREG